MTLSKKDRAVEFTNSSGYNCIIAKKCVEKYSVKIVKSGNINIGFASDKIDPRGENYAKCGFYIYTGDGKLYGQDGTSTKFYSGDSTSSSFPNDTILGCKFNKKKGEIYFYLNGKSLGLAYSNIKEKKLYPSINNSGPSKVEFVEGKYKNKK